MAYALNGTNQYFNTPPNDIPPSTLPVTMAIWVKLASDASNVLTMMGHFPETGGVRTRLLRSTQVRADAADDAAVSGTAVGSNPGNSVWFATAGTFESTTRSVWVNASSGTNNTTIGAQTLTRFAFGARATASPFDYVKGDIAEVAVWSAVLTSAEIASLSKGFKAHRIRPQSLEFYAPMVRNVQDVRIARSITNNNSATASDHPRVY